MKNLFRWLCTALVVLLLALLPIQPCSAQCTTTLPQGVIAVDLASQAQSPDGRSWECAFDDLIEALDFARDPQNGVTQVWVKAGTYTPGTASTDTFELVDDVDVYGGFAGTETLRTEADPYANITILSGEQGANDAYHVVTAVNTVADLTRLDGFIIEHGNASGSDEDANGGGLHIFASAVDHIRLNVTRCRFRNNEASGSGGAVAIVHSGQFASTLFDVEFTNCEFTDNTAEYGGAIYIFGGVAVFNNSLFARNVADPGDGGAIYVAQTCRNIEDCDPPIPCQVFIMSTARVQSCTLSLNRADEGYGGGVFVTREMTLDSTSSIYWSNNDLLSGSTEMEQISKEDTCSDVGVTYSCIEGLSTYAGTGNIGSTSADDPDFVDETNGDFRLQAGSPCIDVGNVGLDFPMDDLDFDHDGDDSELAVPLDVSDHRQVGMQIDMGPYEVHYEITTCTSDCVDSATFQPPPDGMVDGADLAVLLGA